MGLLKNIFWDNTNKNLLIYKFDMKRDYVSKGSNLTVKEGQACIFCHQGKMADVFLPGRYKLDTDNIPLLTTLMSWKYGFENPFRSDIYFVNTTQFPNQKWGTANPIMVRDADYGAVRIRGYGSYSFKVDDPYVFLTELAGSHTSFQTSDIVDYLRSMTIMGITDAIGESRVPILDMAANLMELSILVKEKLQEDFKKMGLMLVKFNFENFSLPPELEKAFDENASLGMIRGNMDVYTQKAQLEAMKVAAANPGAGNVMGAGMGMGMGVGMGQMFGNMMGQTTMQQNNPQQSSGSTCKKCNSSVPAGAKFCSKCGQPVGNVCPKCKASVADGAKFCPECGSSMKPVCPKCKAEVNAGAKFCPECGGKI